MSTVVTLHSALFQGLCFRTSSIGVSERMAADRTKMVADRSSASARFSDDDDVWIFYHAAFGMAS